MAQKYYLATSCSGLLILLLCFCIKIAQAQDRSGNNWIFSNGQWIQFNYSNDSLATETNDTGFPDAGQNGAVATDPKSGEILFYTDGTAIYDAQGNVIRNDLNGDPDLSQQVAIVPVGEPATNGQQEYRVYVNEGGDINYYTVTVNTNNPGYPEVTSSGTATFSGVGNISGPITVLPGNDTYYILAHEANSPTYRLIDVNDNTYRGTFNLNSQGAGSINANSFAYNEATGQIAVSSPQGVHLLTFDPDASDAITFDNSITGDTDDVAWSEDGSKLYVSINGNIRQYDVTNGLTQTLIPDITGASGLKRGPDGNIYYLYENNGEYLLGRIIHADSAASLLTVEDALFDGTDFGGPNFSEVAPAPEPDYTFTVNPPVGNCANQPVQLVSELGPNTPDPDSIVWTVNGQTYYGVSPAFTPDQAISGGTATAFWTRGDSTYTSTQPVPLNVQDFQLQVPLVQDTTICPDETATLKAKPEGGGGQQGGGIGGGTGGGQGGGNYTYYWSTGETTDSIQVTTAGVYWVLVTDPSTGCTAYAESNVKEYQIENQTYNTWYFGNGAGVDFNTLYDNPENPDDNGDGVDNEGMITPLGDGAQNAPEAVASVSDNNGDILFYTDGETVYFYDRVTQTHVEKQTGIGGDQGASQTAIVQVPESDGVYYIFTTTEVGNESYELRYSIFDLRTQEVVSSNNLLFVKSTEKIAINGGNGGNAVLIAHEYGNNVFRSYPITANGIGSPVTSATGSIYRSPDENDPAADGNAAQGYLSVGGDSTGTIVAAALGDKVEIYSFTDSTLTLSDPITIDVPNGTPYGTYVFQDSLGNKVVLISTDNGLYVTDALQAGETPAIYPVQNATSGSFGAIQQASDGQIYVAQEGANYLGSVSVNANNPASSSYNEQAVELPDGATVGLGLPTEVKMGGNSFPEPAISVENACVGNEVNFSAQGRDDVIETYFWEIIPLSDTTKRIGLPDSLARSQTFSFALDSLGDYIAQVTLSNRCDVDSIMQQTFTMNAGPEITLPESMLLCQGAQQISAVDSPDSASIETVEWVLVGAQGGGNLPAQNTITVDTGGIYQVTVTTVDGCTSQGEVFVADNRPEIQLPNDFTLCGEETRELDVEIPSPADPDGYAWIVLNENDQTVATSDEPVIDVRTLTPDPGIYTYTVTVTDDSPEACFVQDTVVVSILGAPEFTGDTTQADCGVDNGSVIITLTDNPDDNYTFEWRDENGNPISYDKDLIDQPAGVYTLTVSNDAGCSRTQSFGIDDRNVQFTATPTVIPGCDDQNVISLNIIEDPIIDGNYEVTISGDTSITPKPMVLSGTSELPPLAPGTYNLTILSLNDGCRVTLDNIEIPEPPAVEFNVENRFVNTCEEFATLAVADYNPADPNKQWSFSWTNVGTGTTEGIIAPTSGVEAYEVQVSQSGTYEVEVTDAAGNLCPATHRVEVTINEPLNVAVALDEDNSCETGTRRLTAQFDPPSDTTRNLTYRWMRDGGAPFAYSRSITVSQSGNYTVEVRERNSNSGNCTATASVDVTVSAPVSGIPNLLYGAACEGSSSPVIASTNRTDTLTYVWYDSASTIVQNNSSVGGDTLFITPEMPTGEYRVEISTPDGCVVERFATIERNPSPLIQFIDNGYFICNDPVAAPEEQSVMIEIEPVQGAITWTYMPLEGNITTNIGQNTYEVPASAEGYYKVAVTNLSGCTTVDSVLVTNDCSPSIVAPNALRPGGTNNVFSVYHRYVAEEGFDVRIYNRWGELVFQSSDPDFEWDGTYKGREVPLGSYPYVIHYKSTTDEGEEGRTYEKRGGITVLR